MTLRELQALGLGTTHARVFRPRHMKHRTVTYIVNQDSNIDVGARQE